MLNITQTNSSDLFRLSVTSHPTEGCASSVDSDSVAVSSCEASAQPEAGVFTWSDFLKIREFYLDATG